jgi:lambda family phage tail tape measure protein
MHEFLETAGAVLTQHGKESGMLGGLTALIKDTTEALKGNMEGFKGVAKEALRAQLVFGQFVDMYDKYQELNNKGSQKAGAIGGADALAAARQRQQEEEAAAAAAKITREKEVAAAQKKIADEVNDYKNKLAKQAAGFDEKHAIENSVKSDLANNPQFKNWSEAQKQAVILYARRADAAKAAEKATREANEADRQSIKILEQLKEKQKEQIDQVNFETQMLGKTQEQQRIATELRKVDLETEKAILKIRLEKGQDPEKMAQRIEEARKLAGVTKQQLEPAIRANIEASRSFETGFHNAMNNVISDATNSAQQAQNLFTNAFKGMEDALVTFVKTGKLDFKSLADSIITDLIRISIQRSVIAPLAQAMSGSGGGFASLLSGFFRADGGDVKGGSPYIVGENGPELFKPGQSGTIVPNDEMQGMGGNKNVVVNQTINIDARSDVNTIRAAMQVAEQSAIRAIKGELKGGKEMYRLTR